MDWIWEKERPVPLGMHLLLAHAQRTATILIPFHQSQAGACAIFGPGTRITSAAKEVLDKIKEKRGYK